MSAPGVVNAMTVDVEDYFHVSAFDGVLPRSEWDRMESRVERNTERLLALFEESSVKATFFVLGWVAERHPALVRAIAGAGHEVASHGYAHRLVYDLTPAMFRDDVRRSKQVIEDAGGRAVDGYRAPSYSVTPRSLWALDILIEEGYLYDSSLFPVRRPGYGYAGGARDPHWLDRPAGRLAEVPPATLRRLGANLPAGGGAYLRLLPYRLVRSAFAECEGRGVPATFYIHPWELDPDQPRLDVPWLTRIRHYGGLHRTADRIRMLIGEFRFQPIARTVAALPV